MTIRNLRVTKRLVAVAAATALGTTLLALPTSPVSATASVTSTSRLAGADRYETANKVANTPAITTQNKFVLASGDNFADGLTAAALAGALNADLLLTPQAALPASVLGTLTSMSSTVAGSKFVVIVGGVAAVSAGIEAQLTAIGYTVSRVSGNDRYATANAVAASAKTNNSGIIGTFGGYRTAFLASGTGFADALSASVIAYANTHPIFLTDGTTLTAETAAAMTAAGVQQVIILGGTAAVSAEVATAVNAVPGVIVSSRIGGADRYETATLFAAAIGAADADFLKTLILVDGTNFPDALAASQRASLSKASIIPVRDPLPAVVSTFIAANKATIATIETIGGTDAVAASVVTAAAASATIAQPTATIEALDGSATSTVTFTEQLNLASAQTTTSYSRTTSSGVITNPTGVVYTYNATTMASTAVLTFAAAALTPGDTVRVVGNVITHATVAGLTVAGASATVAVDASVPSATLVAYPGAAGAAKKVWVTFSANTLLTSLNGTTDLVHTPAVLGATPATFSACVPVPTSQTYTCDIVGQPVAAGETVTLKAGSISSKATTPVLNAATSATATADITPPVLQSARYSTSAVGGAQAALSTTGGTGILQVAARAGSATGGAAGNSWKLTVAQATATAVTVNSASKAVTVSMDISAGTVTANQVATLLNGNAAFAALFIANVTTPGVMASTAPIAGVVLAGGKDLMTVVATFSEPLSAAVDAGFGTTVTGAGAFTVTPNDGTNGGRLTGVLTLTTQVTGAPLSGVSTLNTAVTTVDRNGVAAAAGTSLTVTMTPAPA